MELGPAGEPGESIWPKLSLPRKPKSYSRPQGPVSGPQRGGQDPHLRWEKEGPWRGVQASVSCEFWGHTCSSRCFDPCWAPGPRLPRSQKGQPWAPWVPALVGKTREQLRARNLQRGLERFFWKPDSRASPCPELGTLLRADGRGGGRSLFREGSRWCFGGSPVPCTVPQLCLVVSAV